MSESLQTIVNQIDEIEKEKFRLDQIKADIKSKKDLYLFLTLKSK